MNKTTRSLLTMRWLCERNAIIISLAIVGPFLIVHSSGFDYRYFNDWKSGISSLSWEATSVSGRHLIGLANGTAFALINFRLTPN